MNTTNTRSSACIVTFDGFHYQSPELSLLKHESECKSRGIPFTPYGPIDSKIMSDVIRPDFIAEYNRNEAKAGKITYVGKYCAAKSAGII